MTIVWRGNAVGLPVGILRVPFAGRRGGIRVAVGGGGRVLADGDGKIIHARGRLWRGGELRAGGEVVLGLPGVEGCAHFWGEEEGEAVVVAWGGDSGEGLVEQFAGVWDHQEVADFGD